ncbi:unnamed protein product [Hydatigera taeniaeformis]|uniref:PH domain-containing protein n=1 Tax=Hydatigena taeniaeformis TaxID=6205 RepID=A0A0R3XBK4_HYDTA|nr:unnamed protein product [Hydatigera taeniaeformis]
MELGGISSLSAPVNSISRPQSLSVHDLRSLDGTHMPTEMDLSSIRRARYRARKNRRLDDSVLRPLVAEILLLIQRLPFLCQKSKLQPNKLKIDIDATAVVYHLKFEEATKFRQWLTAIKEHRSYDQYQSAINSSGRVTTNPTVSITVANAPPPDPSSIGQPPTRPNNISLYNASLGRQHKLAKSTNKLSNEHITTMEKLAAKLENAYEEVEKAKTMILTNIPENDSTEGDNSSPTQSVFFSPVPFSSFEGRTSSTVTAHRRFSSISSTTSMCTAVQGPATEVIEAKCTKPSHGIVDSTALTFVQAAIKFSDEAKRYIEEANEGKS